MSKAIELVEEILDRLNFVLDDKGDMAHVMNGIGLIAVDGRKKLNRLKPRALTPNQKVQFDRFYTLYPRRQGKAMALKAWEKLSEEDRLQAIVGLKAQMPYFSEDVKYIPFPASWLNQRRFDDEIEEDPRRKKPKWDGVSVPRN